MLLLQLFNFSLLNFTETRPTESLHIVGYKLV